MTLNIFWQDNEAALKMDKNGTFHVQVSLDTSELSSSVCPIGKNKGR